MTHPLKPATRFYIVAVAVAVAVALGAAAPGQASVRTVQDEFDRPGTVAAGGGWMVATQAQSARAQLWVGRLGGPIRHVPTTPVHAPYWAHPHVGTDARGKVVVVFPACRRGHCDLQMLDPVSGAIKPVPGGSSTAVNEVEGDLDRGALALVAAVPGHPSSRRMRLVYRPAGGAPRILNQLGGEHVNLDRGRVLTQRVDPGHTDADCPRRIIDLTRVSGRRTQLARVGCGEDQQTVTGLGFAGKQRVAWAVAALSGSTFFQRDLTPGAHARSVRSLHQFIAFAPIDTNRALILGGPVDYALGPDPDGEPAFPLYDVTGIQVGAANAQGQLR